MNALPLANPYESPHCAPEAPRASAETNAWLLLALRLAAYAFCGVLLFAAFCTPLCPARQFFYKASGEIMWISLACLVVASLISGLALDFLVRSDWHCLLVAVVWAELAAVAFALSLFIAFDGKDLIAHPDAIPLIVTLSISYGMVYGALCLHLSVPICALAVWLARQAK
jgi:hypothetical protein